MLSNFFKERTIASGAKIPETSITRERPELHP